MDADVLITRSVTKCDASLLKDTTVKLIATATIGDDHIDREFCKKNGIEVAAAPGCNASAVEQYFLSALLTVARNRHISLKGLKIGIIGVGNVGKRIKKVSELLGMETIINDPPRRENEGENGFAGIDELLKQADIVTLHVPLTNEGKYPTCHLAGEDFFSKIGKPVIFINTSRGAVVDTSALKKAIATGIVEASIIDVWENEPEIDVELLNKVDIATPHIAGYSIEGKTRATKMVVEAVNKYFGLGLTIPVTEQKDKSKIVDLDCNGKSFQDAVYEPVNMSYDILNDDRILRSNPESFEQLRRNYEFRKEYNNYRVKLNNCSKNIEDFLMKIGFEIEMNY